MHLQHFLGAVSGFDCACIFGVVNHKGNTTNQVAASKGAEFNRM